MGGWVLEWACKRVEERRGDDVYVCTVSPLNLRLGKICEVVTVLTNMK